jgi:23S rRNA pseudouridine1911/1915/1917 synthase
MMNPEENEAHYNSCMPVVLTVPENVAGQRLDQALARLLAHHSRSRLQGWVKEGRLRIDGEVVRDPGKKLKGGENLVLLPLPGPELVAQRPEAIPLTIVFEDAALLVIDKPAGLVAHPGNGNWSGTLLNALLHHDPRLRKVPRAGIVHRLDKGTSGLLVIARTLTAQTDLVHQLGARSVRREYLAVVTGEITRDGTIDAPVGRHPTQRIKMAITPRGKPAITHYRILERYRGATLIACRLETGRTHQIRVHMASLGHPLLGDPVYGRPATTLPAFPRQALHATRLGLAHPECGTPMSWESPLPADMAALLASLRGEE